MSEEEELEKRLNVGIDDLEFEDDLRSRGKRESHELSARAQGTSLHICGILDLSVCMISLGVPLRQDPPYTYRKDSKGVRINFIFRSESPDKGFGKLLTVTLMKQWKTNDAVLQNLDYPLGVGKRTCEGRHVVRKLEKQKELPTREELGEIKGVEVKSPDLAAALYGIGIEFMTQAAYKGEHGAPIFLMKEWDDQSKWETRTVMGVWPTFEKWAAETENLIHPFAIAGMVVKNYRQVLEHFVKNDKPVVGFKMPNGGTYFAREGSRKYKNALRQGLKIV